MNIKTIRRIPLSRTSLSIALAFAFASSVAVAQAAPDSGEALRQTQPPVLPSKPAPALPQLGDGQKIEAPMAALPSGPTIEVKQIEVIGNRVIKTVTLAALVADGAGKTQTLAELEALAQRITKLYRAQGYFVARAYIPAQQVTSGNIKIRVVEGNYGEFHLKNKSLVRDSTVQGMLDDVKGADIVSLDTLERAMLIINDTPGVRVTRADVMPGTKVGTSDFAVDTVATPRYAGYLMLDNYGSVYTGETRTMFNVDVNSISGRGDRLSVSGLVADHNGLQNGRAGYLVPLAANGLRGELAYSHTRYALGNSYASLDAKGTAKGVNATVTYPVRRIRAQTIEASIDLGYKDLEDRIQSTNTTTPKTSTAATAGISIKDEGEFLGRDGLTQASLMVSAVRLNINEATALANDAAGANTQGSNSKFVASLSRMTLLPASFSLTTALKYQQSLSHKNLDGSERMAVSGSNGVMAYPSGELIGTTATFVRLELGHPLPVWGKLQSSWSLFSDWGTAKAAVPLATDVTREISDVGLGWNASVGGAIIKANWAHRLESKLPTSEPFPQNKFLIQAGWVF
jgi:hemolysin activation/secretion protein